VNRGPFKSSRQNVAAVTPSFFSRAHLPLLDRRYRRWATMTGDPHFGNCFSTLIHFTD
jgi:hypothetical protein